MFTTVVCIGVEPSHIVEQAGSNNQFHICAFIFSNHLSKLRNSQCMFPAILCIGKIAV